MEIGKRKVTWTNSACASWGWVMLRSPTPNWPACVSSMGLGLCWPVGWSSTGIQAQRRETSTVTTCWFGSTKPQCQSYGNELQWQQYKAMLTRRLTGCNHHSKSPWRSRASVISHDVMRLRREEFAMYEFPNKVVTPHTSLMQWITTTTRTRIWRNTTMREK